MTGVITPVSLQNNATDRFFMTYILQAGPWHIGPFATHICAQHFAETHGLDNYVMIALDDPAEAPARIARHAAKS